VCRWVVGVLGWLGGLVGGWVGSAWRLGGLLRGSGGVSIPSDFSSFLLVIS
jgi:hypothetical protein